MIADLDPWNSVDGFGTGCVVGCAGCVAGANSTRPSGSKADPEGSATPADFEPGSRRRLTGGVVPGEAAAGCVVVPPPASAGRSFAASHPCCQTYAPNRSTAEPRAAAR